MYTQYPDGTVVKELFTGRKGLVLRRCNCTSNTLHYEVDFGDDYHPIRGHTDIAPENHSIHDTIEAWKTQMRSEGYSSIVAGIDSTGKLVALFYNGDNAGKTKASLPGVRWMYQWGLT